MKAILYRRCGPPEVLEYAEVERPIPGPGQVLIRVRAAALNPLDWRLMRGVPLLGRRLGGASPSRPVLPGRDVAGCIETVGSDVTRLAPGDAVFGACRGALAEFACAAASSLAKKPETVTFEQAASVPIAGLTALQGLRDHGVIQRGDRVLINGAAGGVGTFAVQIAKSFGAEVTGACSAANVELVRSIGADRVVDYTREDFTRARARYDLVLDNVANRSILELSRILGPGGRCVVAGAPKQVGTFVLRALTLPLLLPFARHRPRFFFARMDPQDLATFGELIARGAVTPVIGGRYRLSEVPDAIRHLETGHARGKLVIDVDRAELTD